MGWVSDFFSGEGKAGSINPGAQYLKGPENAAKISAEATAEAARNAEILNRERYGETTDRLSPYMDAELLAKKRQMVEMGLIPDDGSRGAYMNTPGYQGAIDAGVSAVNQGSANQGSLYSGSRARELKKVGQDVQQSYFSNYMNMLNNMANPTTTTNVSSLGMGQAATIGGQNIGSAAQQGQFRQQGAQASQAATGDALGALMALFL